MIRRESTIVKNIRSYLASEGFVSWKNRGTGYSDAGIPDVMAIGGGVFLAIEVKRPGEVPTKIQEHWLAKLRAAGAVAIVATCVGDVEDAVRMRMTNP